ncbi:MAG: cation transporter, partial [Nocardioidaceae bacterium]
MTAPTDTGSQVELTIGGMTCASCAHPIERKLNKLDGVSASVNYATEKAAVRYPAGVETDLLVSTVEQAGYTARLPGPAAPAQAGQEGQPGDGYVEDLADALWQRLVVSAVLSVPVIV